VLAQDRHLTHTTREVSKMDDPRTRELGHLKLALATFALHLDVFEMLAQEVMLSIDKSENHFPHPEFGRELRKDELSGCQ
jgi:hypothetical protein